ncbi:MAG: STAS domain-containing protein [Leptolyngbyaceae cyanobacterium MAG.088]|nr:STAS domain-containing protein [Leptolyngbyaceae cyanobacterium MAG.088]
MYTSSISAYSVIRLPGRVDSFIAPFFKKDLQQKIQPGVVLVIDMAKTKFFEPEAASVLWEGVLESNRAGAKIVAKGINEQVKIVLERSGLLPHLQQ